MIYNGDDFHLKLVPGKVDASHSDIKLHNEMYFFWKNFWIQEMKNAKGDINFVCSDDVLRQDNLCILLYKKQVVAMLFNTFYDIRIPSQRESKYLSILTESSLKRLEEVECYRLNTLEFLAVHPDFRGRPLGFPLSAVVIGLCLKYGYQMGANGNIGVARIDNKVNIACKDFGGFSLQKDIMKVNIECEAVVIPSKKDLTYHDERVVRYCETLWNSREVKSYTQQVA